jgi:hypothetical protein
MGNRRKPVLGDHTRRKGKLIPPAKAMSVPVTEVNFVLDTLPQLLWIALANDYLGYKEGILATRSLALLAFEYGPRANYSLAGEFAGLDEKAQSAILQSLRKEPWFGKLQSSLAPLSGLYLDCPLAFLGLPGDMDTQSGLIHRLKRVVEAMYDRWGDTAIMAQASSLAIRCSTGLHHFPKDMELPDFNSIINDPESEEGRRARGIVRMSGMSLKNPMDQDVVEDGWPRSFWDQGLQVDKCCFGGFDD